MAVKCGHAAALRRFEPCVAGPRNLGGHDDGIAVFTLHPAANNIFCPANPFNIRRDGIAFGCVEKIDAGIKASVEDAVRLRFIGLRPEGHGAHADVRNVNGAFAYATMLHIILSLILSGRANDQKCKRGQQPSHAV